MSGKKLPSFLLSLRHTQQMPTSRETQYLSEQLTFVKVCEQEYFSFLKQQTYSYCNTWPSSVNTKKNPPCSYAPHRAPGSHWTV